MRSDPAEPTPEAVITYAQREREREGGREMEGGNRASSSRATTLPLNQNLTHHPLCVAGTVIILENMEWLIRGAHVTNAIHTWCCPWRFKSTVHMSTIGPVRTRGCEGRRRGQMCLCIVGFISRFFAENVRQSVSGFLDQ